MAGSSEDGISHTITQIYQLAADFRYVFSVQEVEPDQTRQDLRYPGGHWAPPNRREGIKTVGQPHRFRSRNGVLERLTTNDFTTLTQGRAPFETATVFMTDGQFRAVNFDATQQSVETSTVGEYVRVGFQYVKLRPTGTAASPLRLYSQIDFMGAAHPRLAAARGATTCHWVDELFPAAYHWRADDATYASAVNEGLVGRLTLIMALAAFNSKAARVATYMPHCVQRGRWRSHQHDHGREEPRGIVVKVWVDHQSTTTAAQLRNLQRGLYGAFFGR